MERGVMSGTKLEGPSAPVLRRDPYEVLSVTRDSSDQEIKTAYRKLALKYVLCLTFFYLFPSSYIVRRSIFKLR